MTAAKNRMSLHRLLVARPWILASRRWLGTLWSSQATGARCGPVHHVDLHRNFSALPADLRPEWDIRS